MSFPTIPHITPSISLNRAQVVDLLLASVAFEELGLAHIINAEGEKLQAVLGPLPCGCRPSPSITNLIEINREVRRTLQTVFNSQMILKSKLEDILEVVEKPRPHPYPSPPPHHCPPPRHCPLPIPPAPPCPPPAPCPSHDHKHSHCHEREWEKHSSKACFYSKCKTCKAFHRCPKINAMNW